MQARSKRALSRGSLVLFALVLAPIAYGQSSTTSTASAATPAWYQSVLHLMTLLTVDAPFAHMADSLSYFQYAFTSIGFLLVCAAALKKVSRARSGEESMGWVASMVLTVALMACGPALGNQLFSACDALASSSGFDSVDAIQTCANNLLIILPPTSPLQDVADDATPERNPPQASPTDHQDASWTKLAWTWMKSAWATMSNAMGQIEVALHAVVNKISVIVLLIVPALAMLVGMAGVELGLVMRAILHQVMDVFLPLMIAMLSFEPMRGAAFNFILRFVSVAFWPVAWAMGNAVAVSILTSVMTWVVQTCQAALNALQNLDPPTTPPPLGPSSAGLLYAAAAGLPWGLLIVIVVAITLSSLLILGSAVGAPLAMSKALTQGVGFVGQNWQQVAQFFQTAPSAGSSMAPSLTSSTVTSTRTLVSIVASKTGTSLGGAASVLTGAAASGGPIGLVAAGAARMLSGAASLASNASSETMALTPQDGPQTSGPALPISIKDTLASAEPVASTSATAAARTFRRVVS